MVLTGDDKGVDGDPVVLVLLVRVGTPETEARQEGTEEVGDETDDDEGSAESDIACNDDDDNDDNDDDDDNEGSAESDIVCKTAS